MEQFLSQKVGNRKLKTENMERGGVMVEGGEGGARPGGQWGGPPFLSPPLTLPTYPTTTPIANFHDWLTSKRLEILG